MLKRCGNVTIDTDRIESAIISQSFIDKVVRKKKGWLFDSNVVEQEENGYDVTVYYGGYETAKWQAVEAGPTIGLLALSAVDNALSRTLHFETKEEAEKALDSLLKDKNSK